MDKYLIRKPRAKKKKFNTLGKIPRVATGLTGFCLGFNLSGTPHS